jgi:hypothetical protein
MNTDIPLKIMRLCLPYWLPVHNLKAPSALCSASRNAMSDLIIVLKRDTIIEKSLDLPERKDIA